MNGTRCAISPGNECGVAREPVELGDDHRTLASLPHRESRCELWPPVEGIGAFARLDLGELGDEGVSLCLGEPGDGGSLGLDAEA
jgi:hypothetical protein